MTQRRTASRELQKLLADHPPEERAFFRKAANDAALEAAGVAGGRTLREGGAAGGHTSHDACMLPDMFGSVTGDPRKRQREESETGKHAPESAPAWDRFVDRHSGLCSWRRVWGAELGEGEERSSRLESTDAMTLADEDEVTCELSDACLQPGSGVRFGWLSTKRIFALVARIGYSNFVAVHDQFVSAGTALAEGDVVGKSGVTVTDVAFRFWAVARRVLSRRRQLLLAALGPTTSTLQTALLKIADGSPYAVFPTHYASYADEQARRGELAKLLQAMEGSNVVLQAHQRRLEDWRQRHEAAAARKQHPDLDLPACIRSLSALEHTLPGICSFLRSRFVVRHDRHACFPVSYLSEHALLSFPAPKIPLIVREVEEALEKHLIDHPSALMTASPSVSGNLEKLRLRLVILASLRQQLNRRKALEAALSKLVEVEMEAVSSRPDDQLP
jgi:hypothetical protein